MKAKKHSNVASLQSLRRAIVPVLLLIAAIVVPPLRASDAEPQQPLVAFLVRHAEKADGSDDPDLTAAGRLRAAKLAVLLRDADIEYVHSSDFKRARNTAAPIAAELGLEVMLYDPDNLPGLVKHLRRIGGHHLIVGHSNTTPKVVELLGGVPGSAINENNEFDRLYIVHVGTNEAVRTVLLRY